MKSRVAIRSEPDIARAVVEATRVARALGFAEPSANQIATAVSELARNIVKYADHGEVRFNGLQGAGNPELEIVVDDRGPGIADVEEALEDHFSSSGTLGLGLGGVKRLADEFALESEPGRGTKVTLLFRMTKARRDPITPMGTSAGRGRPHHLHDRGWGGTLNDPRTTNERDLECAYFARPCLGERVSGDSVFLDRRDDLVCLALIDGLGHGRQAHEVAASARRHLREHWSADPVGTMDGLHRRLTGSIGAAAGVAVFDAADGTMRYVGIGNTVVRNLGPNGARLMSSEGTLGSQVRALQEQRMHIRTDDVIAFYTDGVSDRFDVSDYPGVRYDRATIIARTIVERFGKTHDDATCIVLRLRT